MDLKHCFSQTEYDTSEKGIKYLCDNLTSVSNKLLEEGHYVYSFEIVEAVDKLRENLQTMHTQMLNAVCDYDVAQIDLKHANNKIEIWRKYAEEES